MPYVIFSPRQYRSRLYGAIIAQPPSSFPPQIRQRKAQHPHIKASTFHASPPHIFDMRTVARNDILVKMNLRASQKRIMKRAREGGAKRDRNSGFKKHPLPVPRAVAQRKFLKNHTTRNSAMAQRGHCAHFFVNDTADEGTATAQ